MTDAGDTRRLTYAELGAARGISAASAKRLALRHGWPKAGGNDGLARVDVPVTALETSPAMPPVMTPAISAPVTSDTSLGTVPLALLARVQRDAEDNIRAMQAEIVQERERREAAEAAAARAQGELDGIKEALRRADLSVVEARAQVEQVLGRADRERDRADRAEAVRQVAERQRDAEHAARQAAEAGRDAALAAAQAGERRWEAAEAALAGRDAGGFLVRAWRGFWRR